MVTKIASAASPGQLTQIMVSLGMWCPRIVMSLIATLRVWNGQKHLVSTHRSCPTSLTSNTYTHHITTTMHDTTSPKAL